jgi:hypothetical protein
LGGWGDNFYTVFHFITRFEKGNQIRGKSLCFRSGAQKHGSVSVARLLGTYNCFCIFLSGSMAKMRTEGGGRRARGRGGATATATGGQAQQQKTSGECKLGG